MVTANDDGPQDTFMQREGSALLCMGVMALIQILLAINILYFLSGSSGSGPAPAPASMLRPSFQP